MFNSLRKLFGRRVGGSVDTAGDFEQPAPAAAFPTAAPRSVRVDAQPAPAPRSNGGAPPVTIGVSLKSIISRLPADLMQRVRVLDVGEAEIFIPTQKVLSQISAGAIRISFGELRQLAPPGTFSPENDRDRTLVELPLQDILPRLNPGLLMRRPVQKHVDVPAEVVGPFGGQAKVTIAGNPSKSNAMPVVRPRTQTAPAAPAAPPVRTQAPLPPAIPQAPAPVAPRIQPQLPPSQPIFARIRPTQTAPPPLPVQQAPVQQPVQPPQPVFQQAPAELEEEASFHATNRLAPAAAPLPPIFSPIAPDPAPAQSGDTDVIQMSDVFKQAPPAAAPITPIAPISEPAPEPIRFAAPAPEPIVPVTAGETRFITVSIAELSFDWPEAVRNEINAQKLSGSWIGLPLGAVEGIIKSGKLSFPWKALRSWVKPPVPPAPSAYDTTMLDLPLKVVTPLFLAELKATRSQRRYSLDEGIPDLFFNSQPADAVSLPVAPVPPAPVAPPPAPPVPVAPIAHAPQPAPAIPTVPAFPASVETARPSDTNYFAWKGNNNNNPVPEPVEEIEEVPAFKTAAAPGTAFLNRYATPNEIVSKAAALEGVDGALIALPDGLLVASRIPTNMNADTIAAFLPQIFGRVSQCTRELRLGELNNLNFTVGNIPWKIFRVGSIYFAAFGRPGVPLPTAQLVGLAAELDRKAK